MTIPMPIRDDDDIQRRFRAAQQPPRRQQYVSDFRIPSATRSFPDVGTTLPTRRPAAPMPQRPAAAEQRRVRQPLPRRPIDMPAQTSALPRQATEAPVPQPQQAQPKPRKARKQKRGIVTRRRVVALFFLLIFAIGGWMVFKVTSNVNKVFHSSIFSVLTTAKLKGEDTGRVNILVAGNSADDPGHDGANLTDSIMLASIDVKNNTAYMLSIPRDLWVDIPGYGHAKINEAYVDGQAGKFSQDGYPNGGMGLLEQVVEQNFGIKADYYALVDYNALKDGVDSVGGVDITVKSDDPRGWYDPSIDWSTHGPLVKLSNGVHHLNGQQALDLARARGDAPGTYGFPRSDFDRTEHQRMLILALKQKILSAGTLANPVALGSLFDTVGKNVKTDLGLSEARRLYDIGKNINNSSIQSVGLNDANGVNLLANYTSPTNQSALIPAAGLDNFDKIKAYIARLQTTNPIVREGATIVVLNGTKTAGLAATTEKLLMSKDLNVTAIGDGHAVTVTTIIDTTGGAKPATLQLLKSIFTSTTVTNDNAYAGTYQADYIVVLGPDWTPPATSTTAAQ